MKNPIYLSLLLVGVLFCSCSTYQYTARQVDVLRRSIGTQEQMAGVEVNYGKQVAATSDYQLTRRDAIEEAEFNCIQDSKIDVVVDPIIKVEYNPFKAKKRYKASIVGFAGMYKTAPTALDKSKEYTLEDIEKYKLLSDPSFPQYYYGQSAAGDNYYFGTNGVQSEKKNSSLMLQSAARNQQQAHAPKQYDFYKAKQLRDGGIGLMVSGVAMMIGIGVGCYVGGYNNGKYVNGYYRHHNDDAIAAGIAFMTIGGAAIVSSIPMISVGAVRMKKSQRIDFSLNAGSNGIGLGLTF